MELSFAAKEDCLLKIYEKIQPENRSKFLSRCFCIIFACNISGLKFKWPNSPCRRLELSIEFVKISVRPG
jgi:hypothetical protein